MMTWIEPDWPVASHVHAAVTTRMGGVSQGPYSSLNPALHVNDKFDQVQKNRQIISQALNLPAKPVWLQQTHSNKVIEAKADGANCQADASFTRQPNIVCAIMTADCLPILMSSQDGDVVAAIHAGWKGLLSGVISNTIRAMASSNMMAWLGPAIGPNCFEVGTEIKNAFEGKSSEYASAFTATKEHKLLADIYQLAIIELVNNGITQIYGGDFCTVTDEQYFYSYRRDGETGRMATLIWRD